MVTVNLKLAWATFKSAKFACENWHYSKSMPAGKLVKIGVWENAKFIGVLIFGRGANQYLLKPFGLKQSEGCELVRVALTSHVSPVSRIMSISFRLLKKNQPGLRLIVSFADEDKGHLGIIYQASNWIYSGISKVSKTDSLIINNKKVHRKSLYSKHGTSSAEFIKKKYGQKVKYIEPKIKHRYLMPLDNLMKEKIIKLAKPFPKRLKQAMIGDQPIQRECNAHQAAPYFSELVT